jgi:hypothetical protein
MVSFLAHNRQCTLALTVVVLIMLVGLLPAPHPALAQENGITGEWEFDLAAYRVLESDGSTRDESQHGTIVAQLSEVENTITGSIIGGSSICAEGDVSGTSQDNQVHLVFHYTGFCCPDSEEAFQGTLSEDGKTITGAWSPVGSPASGCESWWANVTATKDPLCQYQMTEWIYAP